MIAVPVFVLAIVVPSVIRFTVLASPLPVWMSVHCRFPRFPRPKCELRSSSRHPLP
jgi:hypothetical protein